MRRATSGRVRQPRPTHAPGTPSEGIIDKLWGSAGEVVLCEFNLAAASLDHPVTALQAVIDWDKSKATFLGFFDELDFGGFHFESAVSGVASVVNEAIRMPMSTGHLACIAPMQADDWALPSRTCAVIVVNVSNPKVSLTPSVVNPDGTLSTPVGESLSFYAKFQLTQDVPEDSPVVVTGKQLLGATGEALSLNVESRVFDGEHVLVFSPVQ